MNEPFLLGSVVILWPARRRSLLQALGSGAVYSPVGMGFSLTLFLPGSLWVFHWPQLKACHTYYTRALWVC